MSVILSAMTTAKSMTFLYLISEATSEPGSIRTTMRCPLLAAKVMTYGYYEGLDHSRWNQNNANGRERVSLIP